MKKTNKPQINNDLKGTVHVYLASKTFKQKKTALTDLKAFGLV